MDELARLLSVERHEAKPMQALNSNVVGRSACPDGSRTILRWSRYTPGDAD
jgi:hypothetical protein